MKRIKIVDRASWFALPERRGDMVRFMLYLAVAAAGVYIALFFVTAQPTPLRLSH
jgi:hypothetical protein